MFIICELGERLSSKFVTFSDALQQCNWYSFPKGIRKVYVPILADAKQAVIIKGFANTLCARESFKKVLHTIPKYEVDFNAFFYIFHEIDFVEKFLLFSVATNNW